MAAPSFLQPAFDPSKRRPSHEHAPSAGSHMDGNHWHEPEMADHVPSTPSGMKPKPPSTPSSGRPSSGRRGYTSKSARPPTLGGSHMSRPGTPGSLSGSQSLNSSMGRPGTTERISTGASTAPSASGLDTKSMGKGGLDMEGFVAVEELDELHKVNAALRDKNKELHQKLGRLKVEHEMLRMNESFLCDEMNRMGLEPLACT
eukprot:gnl/MRDRNA2_/MRDRNA2_103401_c0_seq1.p1 gnl/MRDRNA2_/MRDRNA2_103401_c0~~gnl/MRDRNA2_/MRDRNA2_103401_c0_seq1.p1  ORF type:complete len:231 (-),score=46.46 gnl/MRDRNA2_/MRDRNA2_103401_c0_seq1:130-735(-)